MRLRGIAETGWIISELPDNCRPLNLKKIKFLFLI